MGTAVSSTGSRKFLGFVVVWLLILGGGAAAYKLIVVDKVLENWGKTDGKEVATIEVPFILWGGDVATFLANGGLETKPDTLFAKQGLKLKLVRGDDFDKQVKDYLDNKSPFLRGTMSMLGQASEKVGKSDKTRPVVFLQLTWSAGDHLVSRAGLKTLADLKGKKIALQKGGPHVGMLNDILETAKLGWGEIQVAWTEDVTGEKGPAALFRKDPGVDACFAITPDMTDLTGGLDKAGTGVGGTVEGAHVLVSTKTMSRSIADVYACRKDFYDAHKDVVEKFAAGYLKACEELEDLRKRQERKEPTATADYKALLKLTQDIYGKDDIRDEDAADGLVSDAVFVQLPGNVSFFTDTSNLSGFRPKMKAALDLAIALGDAKTRHDFLTADFDYARLKTLGGLTTDAHAPTGTIVKDFKLPDPEKLKQKTIFAFEIHFGPSQVEFPEEEYREQFQRATEQASLFGKAVIAVRGHSDLAQLLNTFVREALDKKVILREGEKGNFRYYLADKTPFQLSQTSKVIDLIESQDLPQSKAEMEGLLNLSRKRAEQVRSAVIEYARGKNLKLDQNQIVAEGVGIAEPAVHVPRKDEELARNRRVEFRLIRVSTEALTTTGLDY
jgi:ABC-type nitrate/sulfonate/bicarbonate transport system substrate-binding protein